MDLIKSRNIKLPQQIFGPKKSMSLHTKTRIRQNIPLFIMFTPVILYYLIFKYAPMGGIVIAFKDYNFIDGVFGSPWVGLENYDLLFTNPQTLNIIKNTLVLSLLNLICGFPAPIILALLLNEVNNLFFKKSVQTIIYLPHFLSWVIVGGMVITIFSSEGIVNNVLKVLSGSSFGFLYNPASWVAIYVGSGIWKGAGWGTIIYLAALTSIDPNLYEAAAIDGANRWRQTWHITLPGLAPTIVTLFILATGHVMEVGFDHVYNLQNDVVSNVADVISTYSYRVGIRGAQFSLTTALGLFDSLVGFVLVIITNRIARKFNQSLW